MDVLTAYLAGELEEEIYMTLSQGLETEGNVCHVMRAMWPKTVSKSVE